MRNDKEQSLLHSILDDSSLEQNPFLLLQSSTTQSALPILRRFLSRRVHTNRNRVVLLCTLYTPEELLKEEDLEATNLSVLDWTSYVPGYSEVKWEDKQAQVRKTLESVSGNISLVIDSVDTLDEDSESRSQTYRFLLDLLNQLKSRNDSSQLICHLIQKCPSLPLLKEVSFSPSLTLITAHPSILFTHIASAYLTLPPPLSPPEKFWRVFIPLAERSQDVEQLVYGPDGEGSATGGPTDDFVVEIFVRGKGVEITTVGLASSKKKGVERALEGWNGSEGRPCPLSHLESLSRVMKQKTVAAADETTPDPTRNLPFNLTLTESQQTSRSQVPLPYERDGKVLASQQGQIFYDPDSADDLDDEDPDEDLDI